VNKWTSEQVDKKTSGQENEWTRKQEKVCENLFNPCHLRANKILNPKNIPINRDALLYIIVITL